MRSIGRGWRTLSGEYNISPVACHCNSSEVSLDTLSVIKVFRGIAAVNAAFSHTRLLQACEACENNGGSATVMGAVVFC